MKVRLEAAYTDGEEVRKGEVSDISQGGAFLQAARAVPLGSPIRITLNLPGEQSEEESLEGQVVRVVEVEGDEMPDHVTGLGIEFKLSPEQRARLRRALFGDDDPADPETGTA